MTEAPKPVFVVIGVVALALIAGAFYVGFTAESAAMHDKTITAHAPAPQHAPAATPPS